jgi:hypothetical protein
MTIPDLSQRQILVNLGNRYVVFGPSPGLPQPILFDPETDSEVLPRVADESTVAEARIAQTLRVSGLKHAATMKETSRADIELQDDHGNRIFIDIKVKERDPKQQDFEQGIERLRAAASSGQALEVWYLNIERLKLVVMHLDQSRLGFEEFVPLDVWEKTPEGVFSRAHVIEEVEDWVRRVNRLYDDVRTWVTDRPSLRCEETRTVTMSEEMMQKFAVTDREIPVLDILDANQVIASFVPRGLWMIGSWGRIDVITRERTQILVILRNDGKFEWRLASPGMARAHTIEGHAWRYLKENLKSLPVRRRLDLIFHTISALRAQLDKDYTVRSEAAHNYKLLPKEAKNVSAWLQNLEDLVSRF